MEGSDPRRSVADCGGCAHLAATIGLAMAPIMDSIHRQQKACVNDSTRRPSIQNCNILRSYTDMKPHNIALNSQGRPFLIDVGQLANQVRVRLVA
jgi:hypothetical protein